MLVWVFSPFLLFLSTQYNLQYSFNKSSELLQKGERTKEFTTLLIKKKWVYEELKKTKLILILLYELYEITTIENQSGKNLSLQIDHRQSPIKNFFYASKSSWFLPALESPEPWPVSF